MNKETLGALVHFMYTGDLAINNANVYLLLAAAAQLQVTEAVGILKDYHQQFQSEAADAESFLSTQSMVCSYL